MSFEWKKYNNWSFFITLAAYIIFVRNSFISYSFSFLLYITPVIKLFLFLYFAIRITLKHSIVVKLTTTNKIGFYVMIKESVFIDVELILYGNYLNIRYGAIPLAYLIPPLPLYLFSMSFCHTTNYARHNCKTYKQCKKCYFSSNRVMLFATLFCTWTSFSTSHFIRKGIVA